MTVPGSTVSTPAILKSSAQSALVNRMSPVTSTSPSKNPASRPPLPTTPIPDVLLPSTPLLLLLIPRTPPNIVSLPPATPYPLGLTPSTPVPVSETPLTPMFALHTLRLRQACAYSGVAACARATSRASSCRSRGILRATALGQQRALSSQTSQSNLGVT